MYTLQSFYEANTKYEDAPLYIMEQGDGSLLAIPLTIRLANDTRFSENIKGLFLGNAIISPALALTKLGFYLEELGYIDGLGREAIENFSNTTSHLVSRNLFDEAFDQFVSLGEFVNEEAGAIAVNLAYIVQKITRNSTDSYFGQRSYTQRALLTDAQSFMEGTIAPRLGISDVTYDQHRDSVIEAFRPVYMQPTVENVEYILNNHRNISVTLYNGNLDAVSNTPGQLAWIENMTWYGGNDFKASNRRTLSINRLIEGYYQQYNNLNFFWINVAGHNAALDNTEAVRVMLKMVTSESML
ncbi:retinoid-inducible serine carboxypeptidase-like isoform X2 [Leptidea sinapis]|nr:retinoid-inducible serine carboxypeptidase-like isoform X2 [Leptidea sinapis]